MEFLTSDCALNVSIRATFIYAGLYYPIFAIQLNAIKGDMTPRSAFHLVRLSSTHSVDIACYDVPLLRLPS